MTTNAFTGTGTLVRLALRRDRIQLPIWLASIAMVQLATVSSILKLYGTRSERITLAKSTATNAVGVIFKGIGSGTSTGSVVTTQSLLLVLIAAAFMNTLAVVRHTRQNEETGRAELIGAGAVGRYASLSAALLVGFAADLVLGAIDALALLAKGLPATGALATGGAVVGVGLVFAGIAAVVAQVAESSRAANGLAGIAIGLAFLLRAVGDSMGRVAGGGTTNVSSWPSWLSPLGWGQQLRPFGAERWWVLVLPAAFFGLLVTTAFALSRHRDLGIGMLPTRVRPATASRTLSGALGLAWRLQRGTFAGWTVSMTALGVAYGAIGNQIGDFVSGNGSADFIKNLGGSGNLTNAFFSTMLGMLGIAVSGYAIQALLRMRSEESSGALETVLTAPVSRYRWAMGHIAVAMAGTAMVLALTGAALGFTYGLATGDIGHQAGSLTLAALARIPAALVLAGGVVAIFGVFPRAAVAASWAGLVGCLVIGWLGILLKFPQPVLDISPFSHTPNAPAEGLSWLPLGTLLAVAVGLVGIGLIAFRRRDLALS